MTITEFLLARIAEDEERARDFEHNQALAMNGSYSNWEYVHGADLSWRTLQRIGFNPARVLAECAAKRAIAGEHEMGIRGAQEGCMMCNYNRDYGWEEIGPCKTLRALAAVYTGHPDYLPAWAL